MNTSIIAGSLIAALSLAAPLHGQQVAADVVIRTGPVAGHVVVNGYSTYRRPVVVYRRAPARVIVVERISHRQRGHGRDGWKRGYRAVTLWYGGGRYYDRYVREYPGLREVVVYERGGRFYRDADADDGGRWND
jgi:hypothetical protein